MTNKVEHAARQLIREERRRDHAKGKTPHHDPAWAALRNTGTRLWLDTGDRNEAAAIWTADFEALTTNNTLLNKEVQKGLYDELIGRAAGTIRAAQPDIEPRRLLLEIAFVLNACHGLMLVDCFQAFVSVELHTDLADDVEETIAYGRRFHEVCPERFLVKVPLTPSGLIAARALSDEGITINLTLGFSARQNVLATWLARPAFVNVFMGRLNAFVADNRLGDGRHIGEKATLATQRALLELREKHGARTRLIGASMRQGEQVGALAGVDVFTMPPPVATQYHAAPDPKITPRINENPEVDTAPGVSLDDYAAPTLWEVPDDFAACCRRIAALPPGHLTKEALLDRLAQDGFGDLFPSWSSADLRTASADGKIPVYDHWKNRLAAGRIGLDALMNLSALRSFVQDQEQLDGRIAAHLNS